MPWRPWRGIFSVRFLPSSCISLARALNTKLETQTSKLVPPLLGWFAVHARDLPWRRTLDPYAVWVSEVMLQQTQVKTVIPYWERWMRTLPDAAALAAAPEQRVLKLWEGLGYYTRARNLQKAAGRILAEHGGGFPRDFNAVLALPGVGRYTAGAVCSIAFNQPAPILDGNVLRVLTRVFGILEDPREKKAGARLWRLAEELVQAASRVPNSKFRFQNPRLVVSGSCSAMNQSLMELGALVCLPAQPRCRECPLAGPCTARRKKLTAQIPAPKPRPAAIAKSVAAFIIEHAGRFAVRQRERGSVNGGLWEFPGLELGDPRTEPGAAAQKAWGVQLHPSIPLCVIRHSITRHRITLMAYRTRAGGRFMLPGLRWLSRGELSRLPFTGAHKRMLRVFLDAPAKPAESRAAEAAGHQSRKRISSRHKTKAGSGKPNPASSEG